ncbi:uncharacterized protein LOC121860629 [Homarus americanus]|uniref:uncharacterized protein LOC121860629 n=1 Tax=Homarus americanus TaxID=6706 RepID=UPI001C474874|nr:uncharacterized protein LOC121860629 [Homarus americanus]
MNGNFYLLLRQFSEFSIGLILLTDSPNLFVGTFPSPFHQNSSSEFYEEYEGLNNYWEMEVNNADVNKGGDEDSDSGSQEYVEGSGMPSCQDFSPDPRLTLQLGKQLLMATPHLTYRSLQLLGILEHNYTNTTSGSYNTLDPGVIQPPGPTTQDVDDLHSSDEYLTDRGNNHHHLSRRHGHDQYKYDHDPMYYSKVKCKHSYTGLFSFLAFCILSFDITADIMKSINISINIGMNKMFFLVIVVYGSASYVEILGYWYHIVVCGVVLYRICLWRVCVFME